MPAKKKSSDALTEKAVKKPAAKKACAKKAPAKKKEKAPVTPALVAREPLSPEEEKRLAQLMAALELIKADPEWPEFLEQQTDALLDMRAGLLPSMTSVTREHLRSGASNESSSSGQHIGDAGSEAEVRDLTIRLLDKDREQLFEIDAALDRIRRGTYGVCEISLTPIPKGRLQVRPYCRLTVKCQEDYEKIHGTASLYRAPASDIIGYAGIEKDEESIISLDEDE